MTTISIQFHATPLETIGFLRPCIEELLLDIAFSGEPFHPQLVDMVELDDLVALTASRGETGQLFVAQSPIDLERRDRLGFLDTNPSAVSIQIGEFRNNSLRQSLLSIETTEGLALSVGRKLARAVRRHTFAGVVAVNSTSSARATMKSFRYSRGALDLQHRGVAMLPFAGGAKLLLEGFDGAPK